MQLFSKTQRQLNIVFDQLTNYENLPMQYTEILSVKIEYFSAEKI